MKKGHTVIKDCRAQAAGAQPKGIFKKAPSQGVQAERKREMEKILTDKNFDEELKNIGEGSPMLVDFWAPWCAPCRMQLPIVEKMAEEGYHVGKVNIDEQMGLAGRFGVMSIPTLIVFKDGKEQQRFVGVQSRQVLEDAMK